MSDTKAQRVALVTGGTAGIGAGIVSRLLKDEYIVHTFSTRTERVDAFKEEHKNQRLFVTQGSVEDETFRAVLCHEIEQRYGKLDVLVNNAAIYLSGGYLEEPTDHFRKVLEVNLVGPYAWAQTFRPLLGKGNDPCIVNISSVCAMGTYRDCSSTAYTASKAGLNALTERLAMGLGPEGIRVNAVAPGITETPMWSGSHEKMREIVKKRHVLKNQIGTPEDIAGAVAYLASPDARLVTGVILAVDAGYRFM